MNYKIEAISILLNKDCILERYYTLIPFKDEAVKILKNNNVNTKEEALNANELLEKIFPTEYLLVLFKRFLKMYDENKIKLKEINRLKISEDEKQSYKELYLLPGVKETRANLYYLSNIKSLADLSNKTAKEIIDETNNTIKTFDLKCKAPLIKEVKTHIAVAIVLTQYVTK